MKFRSTALRGLAGSVSVAALMIAGPLAAQEQDATGAPEASGPIDETSTATQVDAEGEPATEGAIVVTGSRIQRTSTFTSISPLQVLDTETLQDTGQFDAASILQQTESAAGTQIDATFQGFVLNNGPGSQTLDLRGLGADRTLLLVNGRRLAPAGVEGAPTNPSINLIPSSLVARYDLLLDGASSVYGSDAVAGVGNIVLRKDLDGFEIFASGNLNEQSNGGNDYQISGSWGKRGSNWQFGIGAEYSKRDEVRLGDRDFLSGCNTNLEIDQDGNILTNGISADAVTRNLSNGRIREVTTPCKIDAAVRRIIPSSSPAGGGLPAVGLFFSSIYYDPTVYASTGRAGNTGIPFFTDSLDAFGRPVDRNNDGLLDVDFSQVTRNGNDLDVSFISPQDLYNVMAYGEYEFGGDWNITPFFEVNYSRADVEARGNVPQLFPVVGNRNPFNPCNLNQPNGVDCGLAQNIFDGLTGTVNARPLGRSYTVQPVVSVFGDRNFVVSRQEQYRGVFGIKGDLPFINFGPGNDWTFEVTGVHSYSKGTSSRAGIRNDRLALALGLDPTVSNPTGRATPVQLAGGPCATTGYADPTNVQPDLQAGCVPVNLFAPSLYENVIGDFATQAERDYLFDTRDFDTRYKQTLISAFLQGSVFKLPGGDAKAVVGVEWRKDSLRSLPDEVAAQGLFFGFFADQGAIGSKVIKEAFGELDLPLVSGETMAEDLRLNLSGRITNDEFYGTNETYSAKLGWRPVEPLLLKIAYGTSFRAPNLRENFLAGQSGFGGITDPCAVPTAAFSALGGGYNASLDTREAFILENCRREGRDPTRVGIDGTGANTVQVPSVEITSGGSFALDPETSTSLTTGFAFQQPLGPVDFAFNFNYYRIKVKGAIAEPTGQFIVNQCFTREDDQRSSFCDFIDYESDPASRLLISDVFAGFVNINSEIVRGIDLNADFGTTVPVGSKDLRLGLNLRANHLIQRDTIFLDSNGNPTLDEDAGEFGYPSWTGRATFTARLNPITFTWSTRMIGRTEQQADGIDPFSDAFGFGPDGTRTGFTSQTCLGGGSRTTAGVVNGIVPGDGVYCRDVGFAKRYFVSSASLRYDGDWFDIRVGVSNVFDRDPPRIDTAQVFGVANTPIGNGYDLNGREFFASTSIKF
ncbi:TonB-dependent receptor domain-containing protein [Tsuneonella troitsensis]|uniref:TonB-dependent receptor domain-containing protein n=1 Tax=Tsuneonella troitsensis TaxID=292222 RepID=UPI00070AD074|nr:TonB-dependent receptor [Tsuneonella troitsensis]